MWNRNLIKTSKELELLRDILNKIECLRRHVTHNFFLFNCFKTKKNSWKIFDYKFVDSKGI